MTPKTQAFTGAIQSRVPEAAHNDYASSHFLHLAEALPQIVWTAEPDGVLDYIGPQMAKYTGIDKSHPDYLNWAPLIHPDDIESVHAAWKHSLTEGTLYEKEHRIRGADGSYQWFSARAVPVFNEKDKIIKWYGTTNNIDYLKKIAAEKDRFIAMLGHELRNPLAVISNSYQLLNSPNLSKENSALALELMGRQIDQLSRLVDDTLDISRLSSGKFQVSCAPLELNQIALDCNEDYQSHCEELGIHLSVKTAPSCVWVLADRVRISQCVYNLLNNALKFTPSGGSVSIRVLAKQNQVTLEVADSGVGLSPEEIAVIFEPFRQGKEAAQLSKDGLGLGLSVIQEIIELHHGTVAVTSEGKNKGATFTLTLPTCPAPPSQQSVLAQSQACSSSIDILVIEDDEAVATTLRLLLESLGHRVQLAADREETFHILETKAPDLIFSDLSLAGSLDGWEIATQVRALASVKTAEKPPYLVAISGHTQPAHVAKSLESGFDEHIAKPPAMAQLRAAVERAKAR